MKKILHTLLALFLIGTSKRNLTTCMILLILLITVFSALGINAKAATKKLTASTSWKEAFAVPNGGWSYSTGNMKYTEYYLFPIQTVKFSQNGKTSLSL